MVFLTFNYHQVIVFHYLLEVTPRRLVTRPEEDALRPTSRCQTAVLVRILRARRAFLHAKALRPATRAGSLRDKPLQTC